MQPRKHEGLEGSRRRDACSSWLFVSFVISWSRVQPPQLDAARWLAIVGLTLSLPMLVTAAQVPRPKQQPDVKYVPTPQSAVDAMLALAHVTAADVVYDLGSGDGRIPITAAQRYGARGVGIEIDRFILRDALDNVRKAGVGDRVTFLNQDLFTTDISAATVVTLFLLPRVNQELIPKLRRELRPGTRIVSHQFDMGDAWPPEKVQDVNGLTIYLWTIR
jgi:cyclopropane fatty-acyl-phospholipid synthase-like methyltransferase